MHAVRQVVFDFFREIELSYHLIIKICNFRSWECQRHINTSRNRNRFDSTNNQRTCWSQLKFYLYSFIVWIVKVERNKFISKFLKVFQVNSIPYIFTSFEVDIYRFREIKFSCFFATTGILHIHAKLDLFVGFQLYIEFFHILVNEFIQNFSNETRSTERHFQASS